MSQNIYGIIVSICNGPALVFYNCARMVPKAFSSSEGSLSRNGCGDVRAHYDHEFVTHYFDEVTDQSPSSVPTAWCGHPSIDIHKVYRTLQGPNVHHVIFLIEEQLDKNASVFVLRIEVEPTVHELAIAAAVEPYLEQRFSPSLYLLSLFCFQSRLLYP